MDEKKLVTLYVDNKFEKEAEAVDVESEPTISPCNEAAHFTGTPVEAGTLFFPVPMFFIDCENGYVWKDSKAGDTEFCTYDQEALCFKGVGELDKALEAIEKDKDREEKFGKQLLIYKINTLPVEGGGYRITDLEPFRIILLEERAPYGL